MGGRGGRDQQEMLCYILQNIFLILQDPTEEGVVPFKRCKLDSLKRPAYEPAGNQDKKRPRVTQEDKNISVFLSGEEDDENLVSSQTMYL